MPFSFLGVLGVLAVQAAQDVTPEGRAVLFLAREVPAWSAENKCYSCHNNGDAARALYAARRLSFFVPDKALADTSRWLARPEDWDKNGGDERFSDKTLARIQFAASLAAALDAGALRGKGPLRQAAGLVAERQDKDGSWKVDAGGTVGTPATYGAALATYSARRTLEKADLDHHRAAVARADEWFLKAEVNTLPDAAAVWLALEGKAGDQAAAQQRRCLEVFRKGQSKDGGWGPYVNSPSEPFDTAVVVLALARAGDKDIKEMMRRGRAYLVAAQQKDGSWPATTRPAGGDSYAQRLSTTGWATLALLETK